MLCKPLGYKTRGLCFSLLFCPPSSQSSQHLGGPEVLRQSQTDLLFYPLSELWEISGPWHSWGQFLEQPEEWLKWKIPVAQLGLDQLFSVGGGDSPAVKRGLCHPRWTKMLGTVEGWRIFSFQSFICFSRWQIFHLIFFSYTWWFGQASLLADIQEFPHIILICLYSGYSITEGKASFSPRAEDLLLVHSLSFPFFLLSF